MKKVKIIISVDQIELLVDLVGALVKNIDAKDRSPRDKFWCAENALFRIVGKLDVDIEDLNGLLNTVGGAYSASIEAVRIGVSKPCEVKDFEDAMAVALEIQKQMQAQRTLAPVTEE